MSLQADQIDALVQGRHDNVFAVLGLHRQISGKGMVVRVLFPGAGDIKLLDKSGKSLGAMTLIHEAGLFELKFPHRRNRFEYRLKIDDHVELEDPYRFPSQIKEEDHYLFAEGTHETCYRWMGARTHRIDKVDGVLFVVWAPSAQRVSVVGEFNGWDGRRHVMRLHRNNGIWEIFIPGVWNDALYKYEIIGADGHLLPLKADPFARSMQHPPETASRVVFDGEFAWDDAEWMAERGNQSGTNRPISIYEIHAGSWRRRENEGGRYLSYVELADELIPYVVEMGFTHVQLLPISEYPFDGSWGYQPIGLFAPSIRFGTPDEFRHFVNCCHNHGIGVLLDWVPGHFPTDEHGLGRFDGTCLYEHEDPRKGFHVDWNTLIYNYGRNEVKSYLISNANYWLDEFHIDGLRVDAVASMLYLDYSRNEGEWIANPHGGRENLEAIELLQSVNSRMYRNHPGIMMIAEESTAWPGVSAPVDNGGLGFGYKWNMGWMNDSLRYIARDPVYRSYHKNDFMFSLVYAWTENFMLPLSHDEVVHGKGSLIGKMPGDDWQRFANLRAFFAYMWTHPGKKLLFMGGEFAQFSEWNHDCGLDWHLLARPAHAGVQRLVRDLNHLYRELPALHRRDARGDGFKWLSTQDATLFAWLRLGDRHDAPVIVVCNLTPEVYMGYTLGVPRAGRYAERLNSDASDYGGSGQGNGGGVVSNVESRDGFEYSICLTVPPLATLVMEYEG